MHVINPQMGQTVQKERPKRFRREGLNPVAGPAPSGLAQPII